MSLLICMMIDWICLAALMAKKSSIGFRYHVGICCWRMNVFSVLWLWSRMSEMSDRQFPQRGISF